MGKSLRGKELGKGITQRKDKMYQATYVDRFGNRQYFYAKKLSEVRKKLEEEKLKDGFGLTKKKVKMTVDELFEEWITSRSYELRDHTILSYRTNYKIYIKNKVGMLIIYKMKPIDCVNVYRGVADRSATVCRTTKLIINGMFNYAVDVGYIERNQFKTLKLKSNKQKKEVVALDIDQVKIFLDYLNRSKMRYKNVFKFILATGVRASECTGLSVNDVHDDYVYIWKQLEYVKMAGNDASEKSAALKTEASKRKIPLNNLAKEAIADELKMRKASGCDYLFLSSKGKGIKNKSLNEALKRIENEIKITYPDFPSLHCHMLRHTFASTLFSKGVNVKIIQAYLGHSNVSTTMNVYIHQGYDEEAILKIDDFA